MPAMPHSAARLALLLSVTVVCLTVSVRGSPDELALQGAYVQLQSNAALLMAGANCLDGRPVCPMISTGWLAGWNLTILCRCMRLESCCLGTPLLLSAAGDNNGGGHRQHNRHQRHQHEHRAHHGRHSALLDDNELAWVGGLLDLASDLENGAMQYGLGVPTAAPGSSAFEMLADEPGAWAKDSPKRHRRQQQRAALLQGGPAAAPNLGMSAQQQQQLLQGKQALKPAPAGKAPAKGQQKAPAASDADTDVEVYEYEIDYIEDDNEEEEEDSKGREALKKKTQTQPGTKAAPKPAGRAPTKPGSSSPRAKTQQAGAKEQQQQQKQQVLQERQKERQQLLQQQLALKQKQKQQLAKQSVLAKATNAPTGPQAPPSELPKPKDVVVPPHLSGFAQVPALFAPALQKPVPSPQPAPAHPAPLHTPQAQLIPDPGPEPGYMVLVPSPPPSVLQQDKSAALGAIGSPGYKAAPSPPYGGFGGFGYGGSVIKGITGSKGAGGSTDSSDKSSSSKPGAGDQTTSAGGKEGTATDQKKGTQSESDSFDSSWFYGDGLDSGTGATPTPPGQERKFGDYYEAPTPAVSGWPTNPQVPAEGDLAVPTAGEWLCCQQGAGAAACLSVATTTPGQQRLAGTGNQTIGLRNSMTARILPVADAEMPACNLGQS